MSQVIRPDGVISNAGWTVTGAASVHDAINETSPSDSQYISSNNNSNHSVQVSLSNPAGPPAAGTFTIRFRFRKSASGGNSRDLVVQLWDSSAFDYTKQWTHGNISETWTTSITTGSVGDMADWNNAYLVFTSAGTTGGSPGNRRSVEVSWAEIELPDPSAEIPAGMQPKIWNGSSWVTATPKIWNGSSWVTATPKIWNGSEWI